MIATSIHEDAILSAAPMDEAGSSDEFAAARELLASSLRHHLDARRAELAAQLAAARAEAARLVESAHERADEYVAAAHDLVFAASLNPDQLLEPLPPLPLEAVAEAPPAQPVEGVTTEPHAGRVGFEAMVAAMEAYLTQTNLSAPAARGSVSVTAPAPRRWRPPTRAQVLHLDVILPLIAVVAVFVILLAWVG